MPRSVLDYQQRVRLVTNELRDGWLRKLTTRLEAEASAGDERDYWQTLIMMARLDWDVNDPQVRVALDRGLERYRDELSDRDAPPSAMYMVEYSDGRFVHRSLESGTSPFALLRKHIELIDNKLAVLILIDQFVSITQQRKATPSEPLEANSAPTYLIKRLSDLKMQLQDLLGSLSRVGVELQRAKQRPTTDQVWTFEAMNNLPVHLRDHEAVRLMRQRLEHTRATRTQLEQYREQIIGVKQDDGFDAIQEALNALNALQRLDRSNEYRILAAPSDVINYDSSIRLGWQGQELSLSAADDLQRPFAAIAHEQRLIYTVRNWFTREIQRLGIEKLLTNDDLWTRINNATSEHQKIFTLWDWIVELGNTHQRDRFLEGPLLLLEQTRCEGLFAAGSQRSVAYCVKVLLADVTDRSHISFDGMKSIGEYVQHWQSLAQHESVPLSLLQHSAETLLSYPGIKDSVAKLKGSTRMWNTQLTLSRWSAMQLADIAQLKYRLDIVIEWLRDYQICCEFWQSELVRLQRSIDRTSQDKAKALLIKDLLDIAPNYPRYRGMGYRAKRPPIPHRDA